MEGTEDKPDIPIVTPVVNAAEETPSVVIHTAKDAGEVPDLTLHATLATLNGTLEKMNTTLERVLKQTEEVATAPVDAATNTAEEVIPEVKEPEPRYVRRGGRRVRR